ILHLLKKPAPDTVRRPILEGPPAVTPPGGGTPVAGGGPTTPKPRLALPFDAEGLDLDLLLEAVTPRDEALPVTELPRLTPPRLAPEARVAAIPAQAPEHDRIVDRFILYDIGRLRGVEGQQALQEFNRLGPDAIPAMVRGYNRACTIEASCPVIV